jgi:outer membrane protein TolC
MKRVLLTVLVSAWFTTAAAGQDTAPVVLTPEDAIARAIAHSQRLVEAKARIEGAEAAVGSRRAAERPSIGLSAGYTRTNHVDQFGVPQPDGSLRVIYPDLPNNYFTRALLQWPIYTAGRTDALIRAADAETSARLARICGSRRLALTGRW